MPSFPEQVQAVVGPLLTDLGFHLDAVDDGVDEGGRTGLAVYYRAKDCKLQIYWSAREHEINAMIAPLHALNEHGLYNRSAKWHYLNEFATPPDLPLEELVENLKADRANFLSHDEWLRWLDGHISQYFGAARAGVLAMYGSG